jgi:hypothetical protein
MPNSMPSSNPSGRLALMTARIASMAGRRAAAIVEVGGDRVGIGQAHRRLHFT